ncbi:NADH-quinone oxidoreductase subunit J [Xanthocytophaga agilis]|uniref:NADH-quinone oxidoreductase subunit J n=1 Tax=Xanthocytophaga agilis TaxID=3048010 RepID=A0AAE3UH46_9BACT|nr:NADH-quinone oxidoreductase subunit J [Xanthocytophaga agilis]MDJ1505065.1 NADH-quinone oxidoreductase subunit J [Xanthocytophaga agilis]
MIHVFWFLLFLAVISASMVVFSRNPIHSVLYLIITFFALSGHYLLLNAQFLAVVNIIVYAGAIMVLFLFVIMFLNLRRETEVQKPIAVKFAAVISGLILLAVLLGALVKADAQPGSEVNSQIGMVENLGKVLFSDFLLPFELASVLFLVAMVGAIMLGKRDPGEPTI